MTCGGGGSTCDSRACPPRRATPPPSFTGRGGNRPPSGAFLQRATLPDCSGAAVHRDTPAPESLACGAHES